MIELRSDGTVPGPAVWGRVYKVVEPVTGTVSYTMWASDLPAGEEWVIKQITQYPSFRGWITDVVPVEVARSTTSVLNSHCSSTREDTPTTLLISRVATRLATNNTDAIGGHTVLDDLKALAHMSTISREIVGAIT